MLNKSRLDTVLAAYKQNFVSKQWEDEKYKWEAVKWFQDNWNVNAPDFAEMLNRSLDKTFNLLASHNNFPKGMIVEFAQSAPEEVRAMFINLFDENKDLLERIDSFKMQSTIMLEKYGNGAVQHYQNENAISIYLWLRYPDKYYIYKYSEVKIVASELEFSYVFKKGAYTDNIRNFFELYNEICAELKQDEELKNMFAAQITEKCYSDPELRTLTIDIGFFISREFNKIVSEPVYNTKLLKKYTPNLTADDWESLISDTNIFTYSSLEIMKRLIDYGGKATCTQLAVKYGESGIFYKNGSIALAKRVHNASGCSTISVDEENYKWLSVLYLIDDLKKDNEENCVLKMRDELLEAFNRVDLSSVSLFARTAPRFWKISHGNDCIAENEFNIFIKKNIMVPRI